MKTNLLLISLLFLSACGNTAPQEQRFVNPLFYETLHPISTIAWETHLTPDKQVMINRDGYTRTSECILLKNTQESITLKCRYLVFSPYTSKDGAENVMVYTWDNYTYTIEQPITDGSVWYKGIRVIERMIDSNGRETSRMSFAIE